jgi:antibiotic biosynthesis monooxygenase (ABM) superfamily enzyme
LGREKDKNRGEILEKEREAETEGKKQKQEGLERFFEREREEKPRERPTVFKGEKRDRKRGKTDFLERKE